METGSQIDSYTGNQNLGLGSTNAIPVTSRAAENVINDTGKNIMLLNHENNVNLWKQKMADRDTLNEMLIKGQISSGDITDEDRKNQYDPALKDLNDKYFKLVSSGGLSNTKALEDYNEAKDKLQDVVTQAQGRFLGRQQLVKEQRGKTLKSQQDAYGKYIADSDKEDFWKGRYDPFQQSLTLDFDWADKANKGSVTGGTPTPTTTTDRVTTTEKNGNASTTKSETASPTKGKQPQTVSNIIYKDGLPYSRTTQAIDFDKIKQATNEQYLDGQDDAQKQQMFLNGIENPPPNMNRVQYKTMYQPMLQHMIDKAQQYNNERGLTKDTGGIDVDRIRKSITVDPATGVYKIGLPTPEFAALYALAKNDSFVSHTDTYMKDEAAQSEKNLQDKAMRGIGWEKANAYANLMKYKLSKAKSEDAQNQILDGMYTRNLKEQPNLINNLPGLGYAINNIQADNSLPLYTIDGIKPTQLKPIGATPIWADSAPEIKKSFGANIPADPTKPNPANLKQKPIGWKGGYYEPQYIYKGKELNSADISDAYEKRKSKGYTGSINDYIKDVISDPSSGVIVKIKGENGSTDMQLSSAAQRIINNLDTKKGQEGVFSGDNPPQEDNGESSSTESTTSSSGSLTDQ